VPYFIKLLLDSREAAVVTWVAGAMAVVLLGCLCVALCAALFHPDPKVKTSAKGIFKMLLDALIGGRGK
jgi:hypothetical protein